MHNPGRWQMKNITEWKIDAINRCDVKCRKTPFSPFFFASRNRVIRTRIFFPISRAPPQLKYQSRRAGANFLLLSPGALGAFFSSSALYFIRVLFKSPCEFSRIPPAELGVVNLDRIAGTFESPQSGTLRNVAYFDNFSSCGRRVPLGGGSGVSICLYATNYTPHYSAWQSQNGVIYFSAFNCAQSFHNEKKNLIKRRVFYQSLTAN